MDFGALLRRERLRLQLSQQALAARCRVSPVYIYRLEKGSIDPPRMRTCAALADALGVDAELLWKPAFESRLRHWLAKEGYGRIPKEVARRIWDLLPRKRRL